MTWRDYYLEHLDEQLDAHGDIAPPWAKFPDYERYTIGWRMGSGESWLCFVSVFLDRLGTDPGVREAYLRRHPPAPYTWASWVQSTLGERDDDVDEDEGDDEGDDDDDDDEDDDDDDDDDDVEDDDDTDADALADLDARGLIAVDAAFACWCTQHPDPIWPWQWNAELLDVARYHTRELSFWSRALTLGDPPSLPTTIPPGWEPVVDVLRGAKPEVDLGHGLVALASFLARGWPPAPWTCGLDVSSFEESYALDMGYADAFSLWLGSAFDDRPTLARYLATQAEPPEPWREWLDSNVLLPG